MIIHTCFFLFSVVQFSRTNSVAFDRRLFKYITFRSVCQVVFKKFFEFFQLFFSRSNPRSVTCSRSSAFLRPGVSASTLSRFPSACLIYHFFSLLSIPFLTLFMLVYTWSGVSFKHVKSGAESSAPLLSAAYHGIIRTPPLTSSFAAASSFTGTLNRFATSHSDCPRGL